MKKHISKHASQPFLLSEVESRAHIRILTDKDDGEEKPSNEIDAPGGNMKGEIAKEAPVPVDQPNSAPADTPVGTTDKKKMNTKKNKPKEPKPETINSLQCSDEPSCLNCQQLSLQKSKEKNSNETCTWKDDVCSTIELNVDTDQSIACDSKSLETGNVKPTPELDSPAALNSDKETSKEEAKANVSASDNPSSTPSVSPTKKSANIPIAKISNDPPAPTVKTKELPVTIPVTNDAIVPSKKDENQIPTMDQDDPIACSPAKSCTECKDLAKTLSEEQDSTTTCSWEDNNCHITDKSNESKQCANEHVPNNSELENNDPLFANIPGHVIFGVLFLVVSFGIMIRRIRKSNIFARNSSYVQKNNTSNYGKYEGV
jgi:hypothetical protein